MKIYIVTSGSYSDYGIDAVFTDKEKAEHYAEWKYDARVEIYDTDEVDDVEEVYYVDVTGQCIDGKFLAPDVRVEKRDYELQNHNTFVQDYYDNDVLNLRIVRYIKNNNYTEEYLRSKYEKVYYDMAAIIKYNLIDGASVYDIHKLINYENYDDEKVVE